MKSKWKVFVIGSLLLGFWSAQTPGYGRTPHKSFPIGCIINPANALLTPDICKQISDAGVTFLIPPGNFVSNPQLNAKLLEWSKTANLKVCLQDSRILSGISTSPDGSKQLDSLLSYYSRYSSMMGYYLYDKPASSQYMALGQTVQYLNKKDPKHLTFINLASDNYSPESIGTDTFDEYLSKYIQTVHPAILCNSHPYFLRNGVKTGFYGNLISMQNAWIRSYIPFWQIVQLSPDAAYPTLTEAQLRWEVMQSLTYGAQGIIYNGCLPYKDQDNEWGPGLFDGEGKMTAQYAMVRRVNEEARMMGGYLQYSVPVSTFQNGPVEPDAQGPPPNLPVSFADQSAVNAGLFRADTHLYVIISNRSWTQPVKTTALFYIYDNKPQYLDRKTGHWINIPIHKDYNGNQHFNVSLGPGDAEMFRW